MYIHIHMMSQLFRSPSQASTELNPLHAELNHVHTELNLNSP